MSPVASATTVYRTWVDMTPEQQRRWWRDASESKRQHLAEVLKLEAQRLRSETDRLAKAEEYWADPALWARERAGITVWSGQEAILRECVPGSKLTVKSCHSSGKSFSGALAGVRWLDLFPPGDAFLVTSAASFDQVKVVMWRYIRQLWLAANMPGRCNLTEALMPVNGQMEIVGMGRKPSDTDDSSYQGIHAPNVMVILDESCGIGDPIWEAADSLVANGLGCILSLGNPDNPNTRFGRTFGADPVNNFRPLAGWKTQTISAFDTPNFTGEDVPEKVRRSLIGPRYVADKLADLGESDPIYRAKVLGEFSIDAEGSVIRASAVSECRRPVDQEDFEPSTRSVLGVDVGAGVDMFVIRQWFPEQKRAGSQWTIQTRDSEEAVDLVVQVINETNSTDVNVDVIGVGWGVVGSLNRRRRNREHVARVHEVNVAGKALNSKRYRNLRAELWWEFSRLVHDGIAELEAIDDLTASDLSATRGGPDRFGFMTVEPKAETQARIGRSPDSGDALLLASYTPFPLGTRARVLRPHTNGVRP